MAKNIRNHESFTDNHKQTFEGLSKEQLSEVLRAYESFFKNMSSEVDEVNRRVWGLYPKITFSQAVNTITLAYFAVMLLIKLLS